MPIIHVVKTFTFNRETGKMRYIPGSYDVDEEMARHPFVIAHCEGFVDPPRPTIAEVYAQKELQVAQAVRMNEPLARHVDPPPAVPPDTSLAEPLPPGVGWGEAARSTPPTMTFAGRRPEDLDGPSMPSGG